MDGVPQRTRTICLIGVDGSGKTAHAHRLLSDLKQSGKKCKYVWLGTPYFLSYLFMALCRVLGLTEVHRLSNEMSCSEHRYYKNKPIALIWPWIQLSDLIVFVGLRVYVPLWRGFTVVCDRFVHDILVEIMADVSDNKLYDKLVGRLILGLKPRSAAVFLLDVDEKTSLRRKQDIPNLTYLTRRRNSYQLITHHLGVPIVDAEQPFICVHKHLVEQINGLTSER